MALTSKRKTMFTEDSKYQSHRQPPKTGVRMDYSK